MIVEAPEDVASHWAVLLDDGKLSTSESEELYAWLAESPANADDLVEALIVFKGLSSTAEESRLLVDELLAKTEDNVLTIPSAAAERPEKSWFQGNKAIAVVAASVLIAVTATLFVATQTPTPGISDNLIVFTTDIGEQRSESLADDSVALLNTNTELEVRMSDDYRDVRLLEGEAMFSVTSEDRPFRVHAGGVVTRVLGTQFNVYKQDGGTRITVIEGVVEVSLAASYDQRVVLNAGDEVFASASRLNNNVKADMEKVMAWQNQTLIFRAEPLKNVVAEFNRYSTEPLIVSDSALAETPISAVFQVDDSDSLVEFLESSGVAKVSLSSRGRELISGSDPE